MSKMKRGCFVECLVSSLFIYGSYRDNRSLCEILRNPFMEHSIPMVIYTVIYQQ